MIIKMTGTLILHDIPIKVAAIRRSNRWFHRTEVVLLDPDGNEHVLVPGDTLSLRITADVKE